MKSSLIALTLSQSIAVRCVRLCRQLPRNLDVLADQLRRASLRVPLNVAEGVGHIGKNRRHQLRVAYASAKESLAILALIAGIETTFSNDCQILCADLDRVCGLIWGLMAQ